ncbi:MAG: secondary thiamine-phosphate synthase enzyme YjbQ [Alphaproteobacteria bacterium]|nr:secondary thiamine-phosphate synthase enzyme YjbQ [Alphaproteobacteria bacterium]
MRMAQGRIDVATTGQGFYDVTAQAAAWVAEQGIAAGLLTLFIRHTSASLLIQENAAPAVRTDLTGFLAELAPEDPSRWRHDDEGADDMPAHARAAMLPVQLSVPVAGGRLLLGTWQGIYVVEHRRRAHRREVILHLIGM